MLGDGLNQSIENCIDAWQHVMDSYAPDKSPTDSAAAAIGACREMITMLQELQASLEKS